MEALHQTNNSPVIGRDIEIRRILQILGRRAKNNPLLVGDYGTGKSSVIRELHTRITNKEVPDNLSCFGFFELSSANFRKPAETEAVLTQAFVDNPTGVVFVLDDIEACFKDSARDTNAIYNSIRSIFNKTNCRFIGSITPDGLRKLQEKEPGLHKMLTPVVIEAPAPDKAIEMLRSITSVFENHHGVTIGDPAISMAVKLAHRYIQDCALPTSAIDLLDEAAAFRHMEINGISSADDKIVRRFDSINHQLKTVSKATDSMSVATVTALTKEMISLEPFVKDIRAKLEVQKETMAKSLKAEKVAALTKKEVARLELELQEARNQKNFSKVGEIEHGLLPAATNRLELAERNFATSKVPRLVSEGDVATILADKTGIPLARMLESENTKLLSMETTIAKRVVGQDEAVKAVSKAIRRSRVGLRDPAKPIGSFLFMGPSGVGKTELAKALAEFLFDDDQSITRLDMSEFMEKQMAQRLIGAPPGYTDSEEGGFLTEAVRKKPYSVLLFDEIEKAHADVFNLLLQVLDDGRLTDGRGRTADFSNTLNIMTSNIGSQRILDADAELFESEEGRAELRNFVLEDLAKNFRPEFLNRIDDIIVFRPLFKGDLTNIVDIQLVRLEKLLVDREITIKLSDKAKKELVDIGYEPGFGARPLKRAILKNIQDPLAEELLAGKHKAGAKIMVDFAKEAFTFSAEAKEIKEAS